MANPTPPDAGLGAAGAAAAAVPAKPVGSPCVACGKAPDRAAAAPAPGPVAPLIWVQTPVVLVKKPYISKAVRQPILLHTDKAFDGTGTFTVAAGADKIKFYSLVSGGAEIKSGHVFAGSSLLVGVFIFAEGVKPSAAENDITIQLSLKPGSAPVKPPATSQLTSVEVTLDICKSRTSPTADPAPLSVTEKIKTGRFMHLQIGTSHGRAMLIVRQTQPVKFSGTLTLKPATTGAATAPKIFPDGAEIPVVAPPAGKAALAWPREFLASSVPNTGLKFFVEGAGTSPALRDIEIQLGVKGAGDDGDYVKITTVEFQSMSASTPTTAPQTHRTVPADNKVVPARVTFAASHTPAVAVDFDEDFTAKSFLPLIEGSISSDQPVTLSVSVKPAKVPVRWSVRRDTRPNPKGDSPDIVGALNPKPSDKPALKQDTRRPLTATLVADSVGSFHVCAYIDCNGNNEQDFNDPATGVRIDREPFILLKLVLIRVKGNVNNSVAHSNAGFGASAAPKPAANTAFKPTSITGLRLRSGDFNAAATAAVHHLATVDVTGGGRNGKLGLDELFGGWVNNESTKEDVISTYLDAAGAVHSRTSVQVSNPPAGAAVFTPTVGGVPAIIAPPFLDVSPFGLEGTGGDTCVGTDGNQGGGIAIDKHDAPTASNPLHIGQQWTLAMFDSPGDKCPPSHEASPGARLTGYRFNLNFQMDLVFWTNLNRVSTPSTHAACHLYVSVQTNHWSIRYSIAFDAAGNAPNQTSASLNVNLIKDADPKRLPVIVKKSKLEVRFPFVLNIIATDARN
jgi:hypothetical protein